jgi:hypothetical protein
VAATQLGVSVPVYRDLMALEEFDQAPADRTDPLAIRTGWVGHLRNNIPVELRHRTTWMVGRVTGNPARRPLKLPLSGRDERDRWGRRLCGSVAEPADWLAFPAATRILASEQNLELLGLVLTAADPYVAIDIDSCADPRTGVALPWAKDFAQRLGGYTELSYSGTGLRILVRARRELMMAIGTGKFNKAIDLEVYGHSRWVVMTGRRLWLGHQEEDIPERSAELLEVLQEYLDPGDWEKLRTALDANSGHRQAQPGRGAAGLSAPEAAEAQQQTQSTVTQDLGDEDVTTRLEAAYRSPKGNLIRKLMQGHWEGRYPSQSEADMALCGFLFMVFGHREAARRVFLQSALGQRLIDPAPGAKRKPKGYLDRTLGRAEQNWRLKHNCRVYTPTVTPADYDSINARRREAVAARTRLAEEFLAGYTCAPGSNPIALTQLRDELVVCHPARCTPGEAAHAIGRVLKARGAIVKLRDGYRFISGDQLGWAWQDAVVDGPPVPEEDWQPAHAPVPAQAGIVPGGCGSALKEKEAQAEPAEDISCVLFEIPTSMNSDERTAAPCRGFRGEAEAGDRPRTRRIPAQDGHRVAPPGKSSAEAGRPNCSRPRRYQKARKNKQSVGSLQRADRVRRSPQGVVPAADPEPP